MTEGRERILQSLSGTEAFRLPLPDIRLDRLTDDLLESFIAKARASAAKVHRIASDAEAPKYVLEVLRAAGLAAELHIPAASALNALPWQTAPELMISAALPAGDQSALSAADYGIAETGTLVFCSGARSTSSWHFRPGCELVLIGKERIQPRFEDVIACIEAAEMPATVNLVTGPSRTADIEQTIEMGAHGPREVHILITG